MSPGAEAPTIVLVHGVGMWPGLFAPVQRCLAAAPHRVWTRPGYDGRPMVADLDGQTDLLAEFCGTLGDGGVVAVGVSGGATLVLATALRHPSALRALVTHEPLVGSLQPTLHERVSAAARALSADPGREAATGFLDGLYGQAVMAGLPSEARSWACDHEVTVCAEVAQFAGFAPERTELAALDLPHLTMVGAESPTERHDVARLLVECGARSVIVPGCGHLAPFGAPRALAEAIDDFVTGASR